MGSYWVKYIVENFECIYFEGELFGLYYVFNGVFIVVVIYVGFLIKLYYDEFGYYLLNVIFNMFKLCLEDFDYVIWFDSGCFQDWCWEEERWVLKWSG